MICPICHKELRTPECPHSIGEANNHTRKRTQEKELEKFIRKIVREEIAKLSPKKENS